MTYTLLEAAVLFLVSLALAGPLSINFTGTLNFDPAQVTSFSHKLIYTPEPHDGPMSVTVEFKVDCAHGREFMDLMREVRLIHLRNGAYSWRLHARNGPGSLLRGLMFLQLPYSTLEELSEHFLCPPAGPGTRLFWD